MSLLFKLVTGRKRIGRVEKITVIYKGDRQKCLARVDSGAFRSSIGIRILEKLGFRELEVVHSLLGKKFPTREEARQAANQLKEQYQEVEEIKEFVTVAAATAGSIEVRPVVELGTFLGPDRVNIEYTVANRSMLTKPALIGRRDLYRYLVDVTETNLL